jgi:hypothetical protein
MGGFFFSFLIYLAMSNLPSLNTFICPVLFFKYSVNVP